MNELIISLGWEYIDELLEHMNHQLLTAGYPTILRLRAQVIVEELFSELMATEGAKTARLRCTYPAPNTVLLQYRNEKGSLNPDWTFLNQILSAPGSYGVKASFTDTSCTITVGVK